MLGITQKLHDVLYGWVLFQQVIELNHVIEATFYHLRPLSLSQFLMLLLDTEYTYAWLGNEAIIFRRTTHGPRHTDFYQCITLA